MSHWTPEVPPAAGHRGKPSAVLTYSDLEWELLTRLPGRVTVAATSIQPASPVLAVRAGLAGLDGIAAGRIFDSDLIRAVVAAIYAERDAGPSPGQSGPAGGFADIFTSCTAATRLLAERADPADSAAYRLWVQSVAARVGRVCGYDPPVRTGGTGSARNTFLAGLSRALGLPGGD